MRYNFNFAFHKYEAAIAIPPQLNQQVPKGKEGNPYSSFRF